MSALICGSFAYDNIMVFPGHFKDHILPDSIHMLNVSFMVPQMRKEFGGCAGNIAYNLKLLGGEGKPMGTVGSDFAPYADWMDSNGIARDYLQEISGQYTAQAYITTDLDDNQITAFHPGAMGESHLNAVPSDAGFKIGIISPDGKQGMQEHAEQFADAGIPFLFDPGQGLPMFNGEELNRFIELADYIVVNDYEAKMMQDKTGMSPMEMADRAKAMIITRGAEGSIIFTPDTRRTDIPAVTPIDVIDPTGCGDAYRAGLLYALMQGMDLETAGCVASLLGSIKISHAGTQNHSFSQQEFSQQFERSFGRSL
ncbi:MAG: carbohydrate kinase family protein [Gammaproteobacteria bacterium]|nr:carbohydrate kinase family protein [Gammaproteobacteria bacterium]NNM13617.1 carbohydrate kinase family protein [Gammaproteobacteria bacterium]